MNAPSCAPPELEKSIEHAGIPAEPKLERARADRLDQHESPGGRSGCLGVASSREARGCSRAGLLARVAAMPPISSRRTSLWGAGNGRDTLRRSLATRARPHWNRPLNPRSWSARRARAAHLRGRRPTSPGVSRGPWARGRSWARRRPRAPAPRRVALRVEAPWRRVRSGCGILSRGPPAHTRCAGPTGLGTGSRRVQG